MSHDSEAAYASGEIADIIQGKAGLFFGALTSGGTWTLSAGREGSTVWPLADGLIQAKNSKSTVNDVNIAFEYKRPNEGVHGILQFIHTMPLIWQVQDLLIKKLHVLRILICQRRL